MKIEDLIIGSFIEAEAQTTKIMQPDVDELALSKQAEEEINAIETYYALSKQYLDGELKKPEGRSISANWSYEKGRYKDYNDWSTKAKALTTRMGDNAITAGLKSTNGIYDPREFILKYEGYKEKLGGSTPQF